MGGGFCKLKINYKYKGNKALSYQWGERKEKNMVHRTQATIDCGVLPFEK